VTTLAHGAEAEGVTIEGASMNSDELQALRLEKKEARLNALLAAEPDSVRVEYKRRRDCGEAVRDALLSEWETLDALTSKRQKLLTPRFTYFVGTLGFVGAAMHGTRSEYAFYGDLAMIVAAALYGTRLAQNLLVTAQIKWRESRVTAYRVEWKSVNDSYEYMSVLKKAGSQRRGLDQVSEDTDEWRAKSNSLDFQMANDWLNAQYGIFCATRINTSWTNDKWEYPQPKA
jgi:hypothetical protein